MAIVFGVRGTSKDARYSSGGKTGIDQNSEFTVTTDAGAINGSSIVAGSNNNRKAIIWPGRLNTANGRAFSILTRIKPGYSGTPAASRPISAQLYAANGRTGRIEIIHAITTGNITILGTNEAGGTTFNGSFGNWNPTSGTWYDIVFTWDGTTAANAVKLYIDGTLLGQITASAALSASWTSNWWSDIVVGDTVAGNIWNASALDELVIWDSVIDPTSIALDSGTGSLNGASRTSPVTVSAFDGASYSNPGITNVRLSTGYTYAGVSLTGVVTIPTAAQVKTGVTFEANASTTGTYTGSDRWSDPGAANVISGTSYLVDAVTTTGLYTNVTTTTVKIGTTFGVNLSGTYDGSDRWSDPGAANVLSGTTYLVNAVTTTGLYSPTSSGNYTDPGTTNVRLNTTYIFNNVTQTGSLNVPTAVSGTSGSVNIGNIKETIRYVLSEANTTTGAPIDLSSNLSTRVKSVMKVNPEKIKLDVNLYPCVTVYASEKEIAASSIAKDLVNGKRRATVTFTILGIIWNDSTLDYRVDSADEDVEKLMENIEVVLRSFANLNSNVNWQLPTSVKYHTVPYDEETHMRVGVMDLKATVFY